jgi:hypothetical protein
MSKVRLLSSMLMAMLLLALVGCGGSRAPAAQAPEAAASPGNAYGPVSEQSPASPAAEPGGYAPSKSADSAPAPAAESGADYEAGSAAGATARRESMEPAPPPDRPGLGTAWGETRRSPTTTAPFVRDSASPFAVAAVWYNDRTGANAMARYSDYRAGDGGAVPVLGGALTVTLRQESGGTYPGFFAGGKYYAIGEAGQRYIIVIRNNTGYRYECVASVDGLDVIDGRTAAYTKRGYLVQPYGTLEVEGFRRSEDAVAAFRFSSVRGSYASRAGKGDRNVGVIGIAFFNEEGTRPTWTPDELQRRHSADPFPGRYAEPPR